MSNHEVPGLPDGHVPNDRPEQERLEPGEIDLTGAARQDNDLRDVIGDAIVEAQAHNGEVPEWGARVIARYLANRQHTPSSALDQFARSGRADKQVIGYELHQIWNDPNADPQGKEWTNWLGTYLINAPDDPEKIIGTDRPDHIKRAVERQGPAFAALLTLPDVTYDNALHLFDNAYLGSYDTREAIVDDTINTLGLEDADETEVLQMAQEAFDIVAYVGRYYVFAK